MKDKMKTILTDNIEKYGNGYLIGVRDAIDKELQRRKEAKKVELQKILDDFIDTLHKDGYNLRLGALPVRSGEIKIEVGKENE
jgi:hypothetical protein